MVGLVPRQFDRQQQKQKRRTFVRLHRVAEWTGLEPATPGVTGRYSNQLNYHSSAIKQQQLAQLPSQTPGKLVVGAERLELPTYAL
jgi:hypothetical protein